MESIFGSEAGALVVVTFLAVLNSEIVDYIKAPLVKKFPNVDWWWFVYISLATGILIGWLANVNALESFIENEILARILTGALIGGGSTLIYKIFKKE